MIKALLLTGSLLFTPSLVDYSETVEIPTSENSSLEENTSSLDENTIASIVEAIEKKYEEISSKELAFGITIGAVVSTGILILGEIFKFLITTKKMKTITDTQSKVNKKFNEELDKSLSLFNKWQETVNEKNNCIQNYVGEISDNTDKLVVSTYEELNSMKKEMVESLKSIKEASKKLDNYSEFDKKLTAIISVLEAYTYTPETVKSGVAEKISQIIGEVK